MGKERSLDLYGMLRSMPKVRPMGVARALLATLSGPEDPWAVLGVLRGSGIDECKQAYRRLALSLHPDVGGDAAQFASVVSAYQQIEAGGLRALRSCEPRGVRSVGGVLVVTIEELKQDPDYD